jgi:hypothetical protein
LFSEIWDLFKLRGRDATVEASAVERLPQALPTKRLKNVH